MRITPRTARWRGPQTVVSVLNVVFGTWLALLAGRVPADAQPARPQPRPSTSSAPTSSAPTPATAAGSQAEGSEPATSRDRASDSRRVREYRLVPGDKLRIEVYKDPQMSQSLQVRPDGQITMPLLGDVEAAGRTAIELRDSITTAFKEYMTNPVVTVIVVETQPLTAYVMGEVNHPGAIPIQGSLTVLQALALAGGLKDFADTRNIRVLRSGVAGMQTIGFNYKDALRGVGQPVYLRPGDTVVVPD